MRIGRFPAQIEALREHLAERERTLARRAILAGIVGVFVGGGLGWYAGRRMVPTRPPTAESGLWDWARRVAVGPIQDLVDGHRVFCALAERMESDDPVLWRGVERLAREALRRSGERGRKIARRVLLVLEARPAPSGLETLHGPLRRRAR